jgi:hypothetical protein
VTCLVLCGCCQLLLSVAGRSSMHSGAATAVRPCLRRDSGVCVCSCVLLSTQGLSLWDAVKPGLVRRVHVVCVWGTLKQSLIVVSLFDWFDWSQGCQRACMTHAINTTPAWAPHQGMLL